MCTKLAYRDAGHAQSALDTLVERWQTGTIEDPCFAKRGYLCPECGKYHLTKLDARRYNPTDVYAGPERRVADTPGSPRRRSTDAPLPPLDHDALVAAMKTARIPFTERTRK